MAQLTLQIASPLNGAAPPSTRIDIEVEWKLLIVDPVKHYGDFSLRDSMQLGSGNSCNTSKQEPAFEPAASASTMPTRTKPPLPTLYTL